MRKRKVLEYDLKLSKVDDVPAEQQPQQQTVQTPTGPVNYMDVPTTAFYAGTHKGFPYSSDHIKQLETSFVKPTSELRGSVPVMVDHSWSNHDKVGHLRSVTTDGDKSRVVVRLIGDDAIQGYREGKYDTVSSGIAMDYNPPAKNSEDDPEDPEDDEDTDSDYMDPDDVEVSYDHLAFTPFPCLDKARADHDKKKEGEKMPDKTPTEGRAALDPKTTEANQYAAQTDRDRALFAAEREDFRREREAYAAERRQFAAEALTERLVAGGKVTPAQKTDFMQFASSQSPDQMEKLRALYDKAPRLINYDDALGTATTAAPEQQSPMGQGKVQTQEELDKESDAVLSRLNTRRGRK